jgi:hypothetical protein
MINFLPVIYEDELLYSVIARYKQMCGMMSNQALVKDLFGKIIIIKSTYFPIHLNAFVNNLPPTSKITTKEIIMNHTMFPFYTSFLSEEKAQSINEIMVEGNGLAVESAVGFGGSKVKIQRYLRYCPICYIKDIEELGESYFRRSHQIVGAMYCSIHQVLLKDSPVLSTESGFDFKCADAEVCDESVVSDPYPLRIKELNLQYIHNAERLLKGNFPKKDLQFIINFYIDTLRDKGLASNSGNLYMNEVQERFLYYYPDKYLEIMQSYIDPDNPTNWLRTFVRNNNKNRSPLRHLLFLQFLEVDVDDLFQATTVVGKKKVVKEFSPKFEVNERRKKWLKLIEGNQGVSRSELKEMGKGLHTWIFRYDREWYEQVTPRVKVKKQRTDPIDWKKRDEECLKLAKEAVKEIINKDGKPVRITPWRIKLTIGAGRWFDNEKLTRTQQYLQEVKEDINDFRIRKVKWAIDELNKRNERITAYKVQLYAGFGGGENEVRELIERILGE